MKIQNGLLKIIVSRQKKKRENEYQLEIENKKESKAPICVKLPGKEKHITEAIGSSYKNNHCCFCLPLAVTATQEKKR